MDSFGIDPIFEEVENLSHTSCYFCYCDYKISNHSSNETFCLKETRGSDLINGDILAVHCLDNIHTEILKNSTSQNKEYGSNISKSPESFSQFRTLGKITCEFNGPYSVFYMFFQLIFHLSRNTFSSFLLSSKNNVNFLQSDCGLIICQLDVSPDIMLCKKHFEMANPLSEYFIHNLLQTYFDKHKPAPEKLLSSLHTSVPFFHMLKERDAIRFSTFLCLISSYCLNLKDILKFCFKLMTSIKKLKEEADIHLYDGYKYSLPDINLYAALVPGLYTFLLNLPSSPIFLKLKFRYFNLNKKSIKKRHLKYFAQAVGDFFSIPYLLFLLNSPYLLIAEKQAASRILKLPLNYKTNQGIAVHKGNADESDSFFNESYTLSSSLSLFRNVMPLYSSTSSLCLQETDPVEKNASSQNSFYEKFNLVPNKENSWDTIKQLSSEEVESSIIVNSLPESPQYFSEEYIAFPKALESTHNLVAEHFSKENGLKEEVPYSISDHSSSSSPCFLGFRPDESLVDFCSKKEETEVIDGIKIITFETLSDLEEYSFKERVSLVRKRFMEGRIVPTKTRDITKIKGWKKKLFATDVDYGFQRLEVPCSHPSDDQTLSKVSSKSNTSVNINSYSVDGEEEGSYSDKTPQNSPHRTHEISDSRVLNVNNCPINEHYPENKKTFETRHEELSNKLYTKTNSLGMPCRVIGKTDLSTTLDSLDLTDLKHTVPDIWDLCFKSNYSHFLEQINDIYLCLLKSSDLAKKIQRILQVKGKAGGIFHSKLADNFLDKIPNIKFSYEAPVLKTFNNFDSPKDSLKSVIQERKDINKLIVKFGDEEEEKTFSSLFTGGSNDTVRGLCENKSIFIKGKQVFLDIEQSESLKPEESLEPPAEIINNLPSKKVKKENTSPRKLPLTLLQSFKSADNDDLTFNYNTFLGSSQKKYFVFPCTSSENNHSLCFNKDSSTFKLGMLVNLGYRRPLSQDAVQNLELLKSDSSLIDDLSARIAASAVCANDEKRTIKRIIVPVKSKPLIETAIRSLQRGMFNLDVKSEVENVVIDMVDYTVRKELFEKLEIPLDPDDTRRVSENSDCTFPLKRTKTSKVERELRRLINVTFVDDGDNELSTRSKGINCSKEYCQKGCVCDSLSGNLSDEVTFHCRNEQCMFECSCFNKRRISRNNGIVMLQKGALSKEESTWHQKVICNSNDVIIQGKVGKSKREKKLPTRFRNNVYIGKEMLSLECLNPIDTRRTKQLKSTANSQDETKGAEKKIEGDAKKDSSNGSSSKSSICSSKFERKLKNAEKQPLKDVMNVKVRKQSVESQKPESVPEKIEERVDETENRVSNEEEPIEVKENTHVNVAKKPNAVRVVWKRDNTTSSSETDDEIEETIEEMAGSINSGHPLNYAFIWCTLHGDYFCKCIGSIYCSKINILIKKMLRGKNFTLRELTSPMLNANKFSLIHLFNREADSARTAGSLFNYCLRNKSLAFKAKRALEIKNNIFSNTNSLIKLHFKGPCESYIDQWACATLGDKEESKSTSVGTSTSEEMLAKSTSSVPSFLDDPPNEPSVISSDQPPLKVKAEADELVPVEAEREKENINSPEETLSKAKRKYRIGPAHFESTGQFRPIVSKTSHFRPTIKALPPLIPSTAIKHVTFSALSLASSGTDDPPKSEPPTKFGLLCLTEGFGYLPVNCFTPTKLSVRDPLTEIYHCFRDVDAANVWLNRFFKSRMFFEDMSMNLKWVIVRSNLMKKLSLFDKSLLISNQKALNRCGVLVEKTGLIASKDEAEDLPSNSSITVVLDEVAEERKRPLVSAIDGCPTPPKKPKSASDIPSSRPELIPIHLTRKKLTFPQKDWPMPPPKKKKLEEENDDSD